MEREDKKIALFLMFLITGSVVMFMGFWKIAELIF